MLSWVLLSTAAGPGNASTVSESEATARLDRVQRELVRLREDVAKTEGRAGRLTNELADLEKSIGVLSRREQSLNDRSRDLETRRTRLVAREKELRDEQVTQRKAIGSLVRSRYAGGREAYLKLVLNLESPADLGRYHVYQGYLNRARLARIDKVNDTLSELAGIQVSLMRNERELERTRQELESEQARLSETQRRRQATLATLKAEVGKGNRAISSLRAERESLVALLEQLRRALEDIPRPPGGDQPFGRSKGKLPWPAEGRVVKGGSGGAPGRGVLIQAAENTPVRAIARGRVAFADWIRGYGLLLIVDHGNGYMSLYGYNRSLYKSPGDWVEAGELIARVGVSAGRASPGLYFGIRRDGKPLNPSAWCSRRVTFAG